MARNRIRKPLLISFVASLGGLIYGVDSGENKSIYSLLFIFKFSKKHLFLEAYLCKEILISVLKALI